MNRRRPEPVGGHDVEVGAGIGGRLRLVGHPSQHGVALARLDLVLVGVLLLLQVLEALHLRHAARERLGPAPVVPRQPLLPASFRFGPFLSDFAGREVSVQCDSVNLLGWELRRHGRRAVVDAVRVHPPQRLRHEHAVAAVVVPHAAGFREVVLAAGDGMRRPEQLLVPIVPVTTADPEAHVGGNLNPLPSRSLAGCSVLTWTEPQGTARERGGGFLLLQAVWSSDLSIARSVGATLPVRWRRIYTHSPTA
jgi:hypothetical protein